MTSKPEFTASYRYEAGSGKASITADAIPQSASDDDLIDLFWGKMSEAAQAHVSENIHPGHIAAQQTITEFLEWARSVQATRDTVKAKGRPRQYSDEQISKVREMKSRGHTWAEIVEATGVHRSSARKMCEGK